MNVPLLDLKAQYSAIRDEVTKAITEVMESQHFILGPKVEECERAARETLALPIQPELTEPQAAYVVQCVGEFFSAGAGAGANAASDARAGGA